MSWGTELWDKYSELTHHAASGIDFLENYVAAFIKERGKIEAEYAKSLRNLVKKFQPKPEANNNPDEEYTHLRAYKQVRKCDLHSFEFSSYRSMTHFFLLVLLLEKKFFNFFLFGLLCRVMLPKTYFKAHMLQVFWP